MREVLGINMYISYRVNIFTNILVSVMASSLRRCWRGSIANTESIVGMKQTDIRYTIRSVVGIFRHAEIREYNESMPKNRAPRSTLIFLSYVDESESRSLGEGYLQRVQRSSVIIVLSPASKQRHRPIPSEILGLGDAKKDRNIQCNACEIRVAAIFLE